MSAPQKSIFDFFKQPKGTPAKPAGQATPAKPAGQATPAKPAGQATPAKPAGQATPAKTTTKAPALPNKPSNPASATPSKAPNDTTSAAVTTPFKPAGTPATKSKTFHGNSNGDDDDGDDDGASQQPKIVQTPNKKLPVIQDDDDDEEEEEEDVVIPKSASGNKTTSVKPVIEDDESEDEVIIKKNVKQQRVDNKTKFQASSSEETEDDSDSEDESAYSSSAYSSDDTESEEESFVSEEEEEEVKPKRGRGKPAAKAATSKAKAKPKVVQNTSDDDDDEGDDDAEGQTSSTRSTPINPPAAGDMDAIFGTFTRSAALADISAAANVEQDDIDTKKQKKNRILHDSDSDQDEDDEEDDNNNQNKPATLSRSAIQQNNKMNPAERIKLTQHDYELPSFVSPKEIKDKKGRRPDHPDYDARTLYVPPAQLKDMKPLQQQYWKIKSEYMDTVLFFKVGKFYELFDVDAEVGVKELNLQRMGSDARLHVGFPEAAYAKYAAILVRRGYKVACAEQTQTPDQMKAVNDARPKGQPTQKIVDRHICSLVTPGTVTKDELAVIENTPYNNFLLCIFEQIINPRESSQSTITITKQQKDDGDDNNTATTTTTASTTMGDDDEDENFFTEQQKQDNNNNMIVQDGGVKYKKVNYFYNDVIISICSVDASTGLFYTSSFIDDSHRTGLKTLLAELRPLEILLFKHNVVTPETIMAINTEIPTNCITTYLPHDSLPTTPNDVFNFIKIQGYFNQNSTANDGDQNKAKNLKYKLQQQKYKDLIDTSTGWPKVLQQQYTQFEELKNKVDNDNNIIQKVCIANNTNKTQLVYPKDLNDNNDNIIQIKLQYAFWCGVYTIFQYLQRSLLDKELIPLCRFQNYPILHYNKEEEQKLLEMRQDQEAQTSNGNDEDGNNTTTTTTMNTANSNNNNQIDHCYNVEFNTLRLESQTLNNLEILVNNEGTLQGTLLEYLDHCKTPFGKRLLRKWVQAPLGKVQDINARLDAIDEILGVPTEIIQNLCFSLSKLPDLEKLLSKIHTSSIKRDIVPIMYDDVHKHQVDQFLKCLDGFEAGLNAVKKFVYNSSNYSWQGQFFKQYSLIQDEKYLTKLQKRALQQQGGGSDNDSDSELEGDSDNDDDENVDNTITLVDTLIGNFRESFDHNKARTEGRIIPRPGIVTTFDEAKKTTQIFEQQLTTLLKQYQRDFGGDSKIVWCHKGKETYQLEIPIATCTKYASKLTSAFMQLSSTKTCKRFHTPEIRTLVDKLNRAQAQMEKILTDVTRQVFEKFSQDHYLWSCALDSISALDCIVSLSHTATMFGANKTKKMTNGDDDDDNKDGDNENIIKVCRPIPIELKDAPLHKPMLQLRNAIHPTLVKNNYFGNFAGQNVNNNNNMSTKSNAGTKTPSKGRGGAASAKAKSTPAKQSFNSNFDQDGNKNSNISNKDVAHIPKPKSYIPNDVDINTLTNPTAFLLVSGPNMGGKSTLLRKIASCIILAQIGCYVPAESMIFTPVDQIFTRLGANDKIMQGQSTFMVELEETSQILRHATPRSFVILDELGRGTSTFDGTAIAYAVIQYLSHSIQCMTLFTTHYHMLLEEFKNKSKNISLYHMSYKLLTSNNGQEPDRIQFLYKFIPGACDKSFGLHVASLAKLPPAIINRAHEMALMFEHKLKLAHKTNNSQMNDQDDNNNDDEQQKDLENNILLKIEKQNQQRTTLLISLVNALRQNDKDKVVELQQQYQQLQDDKRKMLEERKIK